MTAIVIKGRGIAGGSDSASGYNTFGIYTPLINADSRIYNFQSGHTGLILPIPTVVPSNATFCVWIKPTSVSTIQEILSKSSFYATAQGDFPLRFYLNASAKIAINLDSGNDFATDLTVVSDTSISAGTWTHVGFSYQSNSITNIFIDGSLDKTASMSFSLSNNTNRNWTLGDVSLRNSGGSDGLPFLGEMADPTFLNSRSDALIAKMSGFDLAI